MVLMTTPYQMALIILNTVTAFTLYMMAMYLFFQALITVVNYWDNVAMGRYTRLLTVIKYCILWLLSCGALILTANYMMKETLS